MTDSTQELNELVDYLTKRAVGAEAMLVFVLAEIGEPVVISKAKVQAGIDESIVVDIDNESDPEAFIFTLKEADESTFTG